MDSVDSVYDWFDEVVYLCQDCAITSRYTLSRDLPACPFCDEWHGICPDPMCGTHIRLLGDSLDPEFQGHQCHSWLVTYEP